MPAKAKISNTDSELECYVDKEGKLFISIDSKPDQHINFFITENVNQVKRLINLLEEKKNQMEQFRGVVCLGQHQALALPI